MTVIGLISGTSYDAIDAAAAAAMRLEGHTLVLVPLGLHSVPIPVPLRARIARHCLRMAQPSMRSAAWTPRSGNSSGACCCVPRAPRPVTVVSPAGR